MPDTDALIDERETTHGDYTNTARIIQGFKRLLFSELLEREIRGQEPLSDVAVESIEMMLLKIGRVISGKWDCLDHFEDIAGYAELVSRAIREAQEWVEVEPENDESGAYDPEADMWASWWLAHQEIDRAVQAGEIAMPEMFRPGAVTRERLVSVAVSSDEPGDSIGF
jgi:hypothetical protein